MSYRSYYLKRAQVGEPVKNVDVPSQQERDRETARNLQFNGDIPRVTEKEFDAGLGLSTEDSSDSTVIEPKLTPSGNSRESMLQFFSSDDDDYRMEHRPPDKDGIPLHDLTQGLPKDIYTHPHYYSDMSDTGAEEAHSTINKARGNPEKKVRIYRSLPAEHAHQGFRPGDWVSTSKEYARLHGRHHEDSKHDWPVIQAMVPAKHLHTDGNDMREWGYNGDEPKSGLISFKGGYHQEVRHDKNGDVRPVKRRKTASANQSDNLHRGFAVNLSDEDANIVHDENRPMHERAKHLLDHVAGDDEDFNPPSLGNHWSKDRSESENFASRHSYSHPKHVTHVVFHAHHPGDDAVEKDKGWLEEHEVLDHDMEKEVPIRSGEDMEIHGISFRRHHNRGEKPHEWNRHTFSEGQWRTASAWDGGRNVPNQRLFGQTHDELDPELWNDSGLLKRHVAKDLLNRLEPIMSKYDKNWKDWTRVYFAGSQASYWFGNHDFDVLLGIKYDLLKERYSSFEDMGNDEISKEITADLREKFNKDGWQPDWAHEPYDLTGYVNSDSWDIRRIRPYAAYEVISGKWYVEPPHLPHWTPADFPQGPGLWKYLNGVVNMVNGIMEMPEPYKTREGAALWEFIHSNRSNAFDEGGHGWYDVPNVVEKYLDQLGLWPELYELRQNFKNDDYDKGELWDNDPTKKTSSIPDLRA